jgi:tRNA (cmo5U34)-methyltransferase
MSEAWTESDSSTFLREADCFVPERELLVESICRLVSTSLGPPCVDANLVVEICCGDGMLSKAVLETLTDVQVLALDASDKMLEACIRRTKRFGNRIEVRGFDLGATDWRRFSEPLRAAVSTFAIHHLQDSAKRRLLRDVADALAPGGALVVADLVQPLDDASTRLAA